MNAERELNQWGQIVTKAWQDDAFKKRLLANPSAMLKEQGLEVPTGTQIRVVENTDQIVHLTIPAKPREGELSDDDLERVAGGSVIPIVLALRGVFGWSNDQCRQILEADGTIPTGNPTGGGSGGGSYSTDRSPPTGTP